MIKHRWVINKANKQIEELFNQRNYLRRKTDEINRELLNDVKKELAEKCAEDNFEKIKEELDGIKYDVGGLNSGKLQGASKKFVIKEFKNFTLFLPFVGIFTNICSLHLDTTYKRRKISGQTVLKVTF